MRLEGIPLGGVSLVRDSQKWSKLTGRINLDWTPNDETLVYVSYTTGYRAGGFGLGIADARTATDRSPISPLTYDLESVGHFEVGYKGEFLDNTLQIFSSIYIYDYEGYQDQVEVFDPVQSVYRDIPTNTGDAVNQGWEIEGTWLATDNLTINANYSYTQTEYQDEVLLLVDDDYRAPAALYGTYAYNLEGRSLKGIPEHKAVVWANYSISLPNDSRMNLAAYYSFTGEYNTDSLDRAFDTLPARHQTDVSAIWTNVDGSLTVRAFVDNLFDNRNFRSIGSGGAGNNYMLTGSMIRDRNWGIDVTKRFGDI
jgi:iron complex outermembrane receptor protein